MKTYVTFENGYQEVDNMAEAIIVANENPTTNFIVEIDDDNLPEDISTEDCIYASENDYITRVYNWEELAQAAIEDNAKLSTYKIGVYKNGQQIAKSVFESDDLDEIKSEFERIFRATVEQEWEGIVEAGEPEDTLYGTTFEQAWDRKHFSEDTNNVAVFKVEEGQGCYTHWIYQGMTSNMI